MACQEAALRDLDDYLRDVPKPDGSQMDALRRRLRRAYIEGVYDIPLGELATDAYDGFDARVASVQAKAGLP